MGEGFRDETKILKCGCKIGRSKGGLWFYDFLCLQHLKEVYNEKGQYSYDKHIVLTEKLNKEMGKEV